MNLFPLPCVFTSQGFNPDSAWSASAQGLIDLCEAHGFKTVVAQVRSTPPARVAELRKAGLFVAAWENLEQVTVTPEQLAPYQAFVPQIESTSQAQVVKAALQAGLGRALPRAVGTTYSGLEWTDEAKAAGKPPPYAALQALGVHGSFAECYRDDGHPHENLDVMIGQGGVYGIPRGDLVPTCGTYRGELPADYIGLEHFGSEFGVYLAEPMVEAQWKAWGDWIRAHPAPVVPPPVVAPTSDQAKAAATIDLGKWLASRAGPETTSRIRVAWRVLNSGAEWTGSVQSGRTLAERVAALLDGGGVRKT